MWRAYCWKSAAERIWRIYHSQGQIMALALRWKSLKILSKKYWVVPSSLGGGRSVSVVKSISRKVFIKSFCKRRFPHKSVNLFFMITDIKSELVDLCGNWLLQNNFINTLCEIETFIFQGSRGKLRMLTVEKVSRSPHQDVSGSNDGLSLSFFFSFSLKPRVEWYTKSLHLKYEPASESLHIPVKLLFSNPGRRW